MLTVVNVSLSKSEFKVKWPSLTAPDLLAAGAYMVNVNSLAQIKAFSAIVSP